MYTGACLCTRCTVTLLFSRGWWTSEGEPPIILFTLMREADPPLHTSLSLSLLLSFMFSPFLTESLSFRKKRSIINCLFSWNRFYFVEKCLILFLLYDCTFLILRSISANFVNKNQTKNVLWRPVFHNQMTIKLKKKQLQKMRTMIKYTSKTLFSAAQNMYCSKSDLAAWLVALWTWQAAYTIYGKAR